jgi:hypothetical protein
VAAPPSDPVERDEICWTTFAYIKGNEFDLIAG